MLACVASFAQKEVVFPSLDGLPVSANEYLVNDTLPWMLLCHQARFSSGEYVETALFFNSLGYNCLAINQRSGKEANGVINKTAVEANIKKLPVGFLDAEKDIVAAINFVLSLNKNKKIILIGSSYSASLVLKIAASNPVNIDKVIAFSPGEYFGEELNLKKCISGIKIPVFVACSAEEMKETKLLIADIDKRNCVFFAPENGGYHGSKALWKKNIGNEKYREQLLLFLKNN